MSRAGALGKLGGKMGGWDGWVGVGYRKTLTAARHPRMPCSPGVRPAGTLAIMPLLPSTHTSWCRTCTTTRPSIKRGCCFPVLAAVQSWFAAAVASRPGSMHNGPSLNQTWVHLIRVPLSLRLGATASPAGALLPTHTAAVAARCVARVGVPLCMHQAG